MLGIRLKSFCMPSEACQIPSGGGNPPFFGILPCCWPAGQWEEPPPKWKFWATSLNLEEPWKCCLDMLMTLRSGIITIGTLRVILWANSMTLRAKYHRVSPKCQNTIPNISNMMMSLPGCQENALESPTDCQVRPCNPMPNRYFTFEQQPLP